jgi:tripartite-type tricarboxylate transporter receptor subunit TctC
VIAPALNISTRKENTVKKSLKFVAALLMMQVFTTSAVQAQSFPSRPIKLVVPYGPGASTDGMARMVAQKVSEDLKQPVIVDNRAGASGMIGSDYVAKAAADGYTILLGTDGTHTGNPHLLKNHPFNPVRDVTPITLAARNIIVLVAHPSVPVNSVPELIAYAKANPGQLAYASSGNGSPHHLAGALFNQMAETNITHVAYKGGGPALNDVLGGQVPLAYASLVTAAPHIKAGKLKALGITEKSRYKSTPQIPTVAETLPGYEMASWLAFFGPAGLPPAVLKTLHASITKALTAPDIVTKLDESGLMVVANAPDQFGAFLKTEYEWRGKLIKQNNIQPE